MPGHNRAVNKIHKNPFSSGTYISGLIILNKKASGVKLRFIPEVWYII